MAEALQFSSPQGPERKAKARLLSAESVLGALPAATLVVDNNSHIRYANAAAEQLFQSSATSLSGEPLADILPPQSPISSLVDQAVETGTPTSGV